MQLNLTLQHLQPSSAPSCQSCANINFDERCPKRAKDAPPSLKPGTLNLMFERIVNTAPGNQTEETQLAAKEKKIQENGTPFYTVNVHSRPESTAAVPDDDGVIGVLQNVVQILDFQPVEHDRHRQTSDELGLETIVYKVFRLDLFQIGRSLLLGLDLCTKTDSLPVQPPLDVLFQTVKGPTHDKQNVTGVDRLLAPFPCLPVLFDGFQNKLLAEGVHESARLMSPSASWTRSRMRSSTSPPT